MKSYSKSFALILSIVVLLTSAQFAYAGGGGGGGGGIDLNPFHSPVVQAVANVSVAVTSAIVNTVIVAPLNITAGIVKDVAGALTYVVNPDAGNALFKSAAGNYENAVQNFSSIDKLTTLGHVGSADPERCYTNSSTVLVGSTITWMGYGGVVGATFDFSGTDNFSQHVVQDTLNGTVSASVTYSKPGIKSASVHWTDKSQSGTVSCSGSITVVSSPSQLNTTQTNQNTTGNPSGGKGKGNGINGLGNSALGALGSISNPIDISVGTLCSAVQTGVNDKIYAGGKMTWNLGLPTNVPVLGNLDVNWKGADIGAVQTSAASLVTRYLTIGQKPITATLIGKDTDGTYYSATCNATTTVYVASSTIKEI